MDLLQSQGENDAEYTTYRIGTVDPTEIHNLTAISPPTSRGSPPSTGSKIEV